MSVSGRSIFYLKFKPTFFGGFYLSPCNRILFLLIACLLLVESGSFLSFTILDLASSIAVVVWNIRVSSVVEFVALRLHKEVYSHLQLISRFHGNIRGKTCLWISDCRINKNLILKISLISVLFLSAFRLLFFYKFLLHLLQINKILEKINIKNNKSLLNPLNPHSVRFIFLN